jgi:hypothetical protein
MRRQEQQYANLFSKHRQSQSPPIDDDEPPETVYLILYHNEQQQQQQHVHTIEYPMGSNMNYILAFIDEDDCINFATSLQRDNNLHFTTNANDNNPLPMVEVTMFEPFAIYCDMNSMRYIIVPRGFGLTPPQMNANDDDDDDDNYDVNNDTHELDSWG